MTMTATAAPAPRFLKARETAGFVLWMGVCACTFPLGLILFCDWMHYAAKYPRGQARVRDWLMRPVHKWRTGRRPDQGL